jgi:hypothetical protein
MLEIMQFIGQDGAHVFGTVMIILAIGFAVGMGRQQGL